MKAYEGDSHVTEWKLLDDMYGETEWTFRYDGEPMEICRYRTGEAQEPRRAVNEVTAHFSTPYFQDVSDAYPGSCCFKADDGCYVIWKVKDVYRILGAKAKDVADAVYRT